MTLVGSVYPDDAKRPAFYNHQWLQYLLDNFATVPEVLDGLATSRPDGHCQWHFLVADRDGRAAVIEFLDGRAVVHAGDSLPTPVLGNLAYDDEMKALGEFEGFGGTRPVAFADKESGRRSSSTSTSRPPATRRHASPRGARPRTPPSSGARSTPGRWGRWGSSS